METARNVVVIELAAVAKAKVKVAADDKFGAGGQLHGEAFCVLIVVQVELLFVIRRDLDEFPVAGRDGSGQWQG